MLKKILYPSLFVLSILIFFRAIPLDTLHLHVGLIGCVGAITAMVLAFMSLLQFFPVKDAKEPTAEAKTDSSFGCLVIVGIMLFFFIYAFAFITDVTARTNKELENNGAFAKGIISDGSMLKIKGADLSNLTIKYRAENGKEYFANLDISAAEFSQYYQYQELPILYSKKYPYIIQVIKNQAQLKKYYIKSLQGLPDLTLNDLLKIFKIKSPEAVVQYLNVINKQWVNAYGSESNTATYINGIKNIGVKTIGTNKLQYIHSSMDTTLYSKQLQELGFIAETINSNDKRLYKNEHFAISVSNTTVPDVESVRTTNNTKQVTIVEIDKLDK